MLAAVRRDRDLVEELRDIYAGECQICGWAPAGWAPGRTYGTELCEAHHVPCSAGEARTASRGSTPLSPDG
jgi:hypothetical protein